MSDHSSPKPSTSGNKKASKYLVIGLAIFLLFGILGVFGAMMSSNKAKQAQQAESDKKVAAKALADAGVTSSGSSESAHVAAVASQPYQASVGAGLTLGLNFGKGSGSDGAAVINVPADQKVDCKHEPPKGIQTYIAPSNSTEGGAMMQGHCGYGLKIKNFDLPGPDITGTCIDYYSGEAVELVSPTQNCRTWRYKSKTAEPKEIQYAWIPMTD